MTSMENSKIEMPQALSPKSLLDMAPTIGKTMVSGLSDHQSLSQKMSETPPVWVRFVSGALGFFASLLIMAIPAIVLLTMDRVIPSQTSAPLLSLLGLGLGTAVSVCLIDLMRMRALERYFANVRGLVLYQDSCFALFWVFAMAFLHPILPIIPLVVAGFLFVMWVLRKPKSRQMINASRTQDLDPILVDAVGLGSAYIQKSAEGEIAAEAQPDFQTVGQTSLINLLQFSTIISSVILTGWLHLQGHLTLGMMMATVFLVQLVANVFIRFYQVQCLKPPKADLSAFALSGNDTSTKRRQNPSAQDDMVLLSLADVEDFGFSPFSADLFQGLCMVLIGPSGSGKSDLLKAIATGQFYEGKMTYKGQNWGRNHGRLPSISFAPSSPISLNGTVVENVTCFDPNASSLPAIELVRKLDPYEDVFGDMDFINQSIDQNFSAQGQIVSLARTFWRESEIIILDTPETYLDKASRSALMALILHAKTEGKIVIMATDDDFLMQAADEVVKMERGDVTDRGPMDEVLERYDQRWVRVSFSPTKRDAFRLSMWLDAQFPRGMEEDLKTRVRQAAQDMLFLAPRDQVIGDQDEVLFDVRMTTNSVDITMHDHGDLVVVDQLKGNQRTEFERVETASDGFSQTLREGYRQFAVHFSADRTPKEPKIAAGA